MSGLADEEEYFAGVSQGGTKEAASSQKLAGSGLRMRLLVSPITRQQARQGIPIQIGSQRSDAQSDSERHFQSRPTVRSAAPGY